MQDRLFVRHETNRVCINIYKLCFVKNVVKK